MIWLVQNLRTVALAVFAVGLLLAYWALCNAIENDVRDEVRLETAEGANAAYQSTLETKRRQDENRALPRTIDRARDRLHSGTY